MDRKEDNRFGILSSLLKIKIYYENDLGKDNDNLNAYIWEMEKSTQYDKKVDLPQAIEKTKGFWKELITESIEELLKSIKSRKGRGGEFAKNKKELEKIKEDITFGEIDLETYEATYEETLKDVGEIIKEKITNLNIANRKFWKGLLIGVGLTAIVSFLIAVYYP